MIQPIHPIRNQRCYLNPLSNSRTHILHTLVHRLMYIDRYINGLHEGILHLESYATPDYDLKLKVCLRKYFEISDHQRLSLERRSELSD